MKTFYSAVIKNIEVIDDLKVFVINIYTNDSKIDDYVSIVVKGDTVLSKNGRDKVLNACLAAFKQNIDVNEEVERMNRQLSMNVVVTFEISEFSFEC
jgi:hypothetical protein